MMNRKIVLSKRAANKLSGLPDFLEKEWSEKVKKEFIKKLDKSFTLIGRNPESFEKTDLVKGLHRCVITRQTKIYYKFNAKSVFIITLFDNRQNPDKIKSKI